MRYNGAGQPFAIPGVIPAASYNANGSVAALTYANGVVTRYGYDADRELLSSITSSKGSAVVQNNTFTRNSAGMLTSISSPFGGEDARYFASRQPSRCRPSVRRSESHVIFAMAHMPNRRK